MAHFYLRRQLREDTTAKLAAKIVPHLWYASKAKEAIARRMAEAMLGMVKLDIAGLKGAYEPAT